ncbi:Uncharacterised protein [[Clostridium] sordellii]|uniref:hypothetical protein n=1 Tax=Paraclostridium sordellii TaxID=1505 RepID=UPI0005E031EA|nr:hypothetical protein [Paeniclostridium sordellii]CEQ01589.1 Uncharacterised protein [[Clostridium] sordellii] [Paeniclostridium sordellii]
MWIISQDRKHVLRATNFWLNSVKGGICSIGAGYGFGNEDEFWNNIGSIKKIEQRKYLRI